MDEYPTEYLRASDDPTEPHPSTDERTHWKGCWRIHLPCATQRIETLERLSRSLLDDMVVTDSHHSASVPYATLIALMAELDQW